MTSSRNHVGGCGSARVPFQELIDLAVSLMHKIPPRNLVNLARRYHAEITLRPLMAQSSSIALLQPPPSWTLASHAESDWSIRRRMRIEGYGCPTRKLNRHQRKNRLKLGPVGHGVPPSSHGGAHPATLKSTGRAGAPRPLRLEGSSFRALIASGMGPDGLAEARKSHKKRRLMARSLAVVIVSVMVALVRKHYSGRSLPHLSSSSSTCMESLDDMVSETSSGVSDPALAEGNFDTTSDKYETSSVGEGGRSVLDVTTESGSEMTVEIGSKSDRKKQLDLCVNDEVSCFFLNQA